MKVVNGVYTLLFTVEIKTTLNIKAVVQLWRQLYLFGRLAQETQAESKTQVRLKGVVVYASKGNRYNTHFHLLCSRNFQSEINLG